MFESLLRTEESKQIFFRKIKILICQSDFATINMSQSFVKHIRSLVSGKTGCNKLSAFFSSSFMSRYIVDNDNCNFSAQ